MRRWWRAPGSALLALLLPGAWLPAALADDVDARGNVSLQWQVFLEDAERSDEPFNNVSLSSEIELYTPIGDSGSLTVTPFVRVDGQDAERSNARFREFIYAYAADSWEFKVGIGKVFWGVAESLNLVDVINQQDSVESQDSSDKLGQPMVNVLLLRDWGTVDFYLLPGFREQTFAGINGRPRGPLPIDTANAQFESDDEENHVDAAIRYSHVLGDWDLGLHAFHGTARDPLIRFNPLTGSLVPFYHQTTQLGIDAQATLESWLLKGELVHRAGDAIDDHVAAVAGLEYSFYGIGGSDVDLGIVSEYLFDDRGDEATQPFQSDVLLGLRLAFNDEQSTDALLGVIADADGGGQLISLEASRRLGDSFRLTLDANWWINTDDDPILDAFRDEDFLQAELGYFF